MRQFLPVLVLFCVLSGAPAWAGPLEDARACDLAAASTEDPDKPADVPGIAAAAIDGPKASALCKAAVGSNPKLPRMMFNYARALQKDTPDSVEACGLYSVASDEGHVASLINLGRCFQSGQGRPRDFVQAYESYIKAASPPHSHRIAMFNVGIMHMNGQGVPPDAALAGNFICRASDKGLEAATLTCAYFRLRGLGVPQDLAGARQTLEAAAEKANPSAYYFLSEMYREGLGVPADAGKAWDYAVLAESKRNPLAGVAMARAKFMDRLSPAEAKTWYDRLRADAKSLVVSVRREALFDLYRYHSDGKFEKPDSFKAAQGLYGALRNAQIDAYRLLVIEAGKNLPPDILDAVQFQMTAEKMDFRPQSGALDRTAVAALAARALQAQ